MKILGIGVDIIQNKRIKKLISNKMFLKRTFTLKEIHIAKNKSDKNNYFAKRFAAKEAFSKSLGTGFRKNLNLKDVEISNDNLGKPYFLKSKKLKNMIYRKFKIRNFDILLSISDEKEYSIAFTILQSK